MLRHLVKNRAGSTVQCRASAGACDLAETCTGTSATCPADAKKCTYKGTMPDAVAGKAVPVTEIVTYTDDDHFSFEMHGPGPGGKNFKMMEIVYTRAK